MTRQTAAALASLTLGAVLWSGAHAQQDFSDVEIQTIEVTDGIFMLVGAGGNVTVQVGEDGVFVVDTQFAPLSGRIIDAIEDLSDEPIRYIVNTHHHPDHVGGNADLRQAGDTVSGGNMQGAISDAGEGAQIIAHENALFRLSGMEDDEAIPSEGWPTNTYFTDEKQIHYNGEGIRIMHFPSAHTDGDSVIFFRQSDVIAAGDIFSTESYPVIDLEAGGSYAGIVEGLNRLVDMIIPVYGQDGGTQVVPGHGRLSGLGDVLDFREMVFVVRDRINAMIDEGMTLEQVQAAQPTYDYDPVYGDGFLTPEEFVEAAFRSLSDARNGQD